MDLEALIPLGMCLLLAFVFTFKHQWVNAFLSLMHKGISIIHMAPRDPNQFIASRSILKSVGYVFWMVFVLALIVLIRGEPF